MSAAPATVAETDLLVRMRMRGSMRTGLNFPPYHHAFFTGEHPARDAILSVLPEGFEGASPINSDLALRTPGVVSQVFAVEELLREAVQFR
jgi:hypothetical protein